MTVSGGLTAHAGIVDVTFHSRVWTRVYVGQLELIPTFRTNGHFLVHSLTKNQNHVHFML